MESSNIERHINGGVEEHFISGTVELNSPEEVREFMKQSGAYPFDVDTWCGMFLPHIPEEMFPLVIHREYGPGAWEDLSEKEKRIALVVESWSEEIEEE